MSLNTYILHRWYVIKAGFVMLGLVGLTLSGVSADESKRSALKFEVPSCTTYYNKSKKQYEDRNIFVNWIFQLAAYGNAPRRKEFEAMSGHLDWLKDNLDRTRPYPIGEMIWCTFESMAMENASPPDNIYAGYVPDTGKKAAYQARFWLAYDLNRNAVQDMLTLIQRGVQTGVGISDRTQLDPHWTDAIYTYSPLMAEAYKVVHELGLSPDKKRLMGDALDVAVSLTAAIKGEIGNAYTNGAEEKRIPEQQVNHQLHCEVVDSTRREEMNCKVGGLIHDRILVSVNDLSAEFKKLEREIENSAKTINVLNADLMVVDRNLLTYTKVFEDFEKDSLDKQFVSSLEGLEAILAQRGLMGEKSPEVWKSDGLELNPESAIYRACRDSQEDKGDKADKVCSYCEIKKPLSYETLEQYLICFHAVSLKQAEKIQALVTKPSPEIRREKTPLKGTCASKAGGIVEKPKREEIVADCFLDWVWDIDPVLAAQIKQAFQRSVGDE